MAKSEVRSKPKHIYSNECEKPGLILGYAHETCQTFQEVFDVIREDRRGGPTDEEQDILRAMLVFACAGLDETLKQLIRDALPAIVARNDTAAQELRKYLVRKASRGDPEADEGLSVNIGFVADILLQANTRDACIDALAQDLAGHSLQSFDEVMRAAKHLGLETGELVAKKPDISKALKARNQIIHEMDIDFGAPKRNRFQRKREDMVNMTNAVLSFTDALLAKAEEVLRG